MPHSTILRINSEEDIINKEPQYQRRGEIWTLEKRQLLIDSILNNYDVPKLYFHALPEKFRKKSKNEFMYAIIDGRQRLETIWKFINGEFALAEDFKYFQNSEVKAGGLTYPDLAKKYPKLKIMFDSFVLPIICVDTDDLDLIEDMFLRLNEAVPLNAAEKRNAIGGSMAKVIRDISNHNFFKNNVKFNNSRYQHREVAARLIFIEYSLQTNKRILDTKKSYLDTLVKNFKVDKNKTVAKLGQKVRIVLDEMEVSFINKDELLQAQAIIPIYYLLFREAIADGYNDQLMRTHLLHFKKDLQKNRSVAADNISKANYDLLEFDKMSIQGTNDAVSIRERFRILKEYLFDNYSLNLNNKKKRNKKNGD